MQVKSVQSIIKQELRKVRSRMNTLRMARKRSLLLWEFTKHRELSPYGKDSYLESIDRMVREYNSDQAVQLFSNRKVLGLTIGMVKKSRFKISKPLELEELTEFKELSLKESELMDALNTCGNKVVVV